MPGYPAHLPALPPRGAVDGEDAANVQHFAVIQRVGLHDGLARAGVQRQQHEQAGQQRPPRLVGATQLLIH